jgi:hypothetical protein
MTGQSRRCDVLSSTNHGGRGLLLGHCCLEGGTCRWLDRNYASRFFDLGRGTVCGNRLLALTSVLFLPLFACRDARTPGEAGASMIEGGGGMSLAVTTTAFSLGGAIPKGYTCDGADTSPDLSWSGAPAGVHSFALIADDPDARVGTWTH